MTPCYYCEADAEICKTCIHSDKYIDPTDEIERLESENAQLKAALAEQKETIQFQTERYKQQNAFSDAYVNQNKEQAALIEKLAEALKQCKEPLVYCGNCKKEALAAYSEWKGK